MPFNSLFPFSFNGGRPFSPVSISAPMRRNGSATRPMGREERDASPVSVTGNFWPASKPANKRIDVPELPTYKGSLGCFKPCIPTPCTKTSPFSGPSISTPIAVNADKVASASSPSKKPWICVSPSAIAPNIIER